MQASVLKLKSIVIAAITLGLWGLNVQADLFDFFNGDSLASGSRYAFVPARDRNLIIAIDTVENEIAAEIPVETSTGPIVISDQLDALFVTDPAGDRVFVIDLKNREIKKILDLGMRPDAALLNPFDRYVAFGSQVGDLSIWDMQTYKEMFKLDGLGNALNMTYSFDGRELYIVNNESNSIHVIEMHSRKKVAEIKLGEIKAGTEISALSRSVDGFTGYVSLTSENKLLVIDLINWQLKRTLPMADEPIRPYSTADNRYILVPHRGAKHLSVLSSLSHEVIATIPTELEAKEINTGWLDTVAFIMPSSGNKISVIDLDELRHTGFIELPGMPDNGLVTSDSRKLLTAFSDTGGVAVIDTRDRRLITSMPTGSHSLSGIEIGVSNNVCH